MNTLDIIILVCFAPFLIQGITKGFIVQVTSVVSLLAGTWLSFRFSDAVCEWLLPYMDVSDKILHVVAFSLIMVAVILVFHMVGRLLRGLFKIVLLGWLDRLLGIVLSLLLGTMAIGVVIMLFDTVNSQFSFVSDEQLAESMLYTPVKEFAYTIFPYFKELLFKQ